MKRIINKVNIFKKLTLLAILVCLVLGLSQTALASGTFRVTAGVHVRETGSTSAKSLTVVVEGAGVDVLEHNPAGWSKVKVGSTTGYIRSDFLKLHIGDAAATFRVTDGVHVRASASTSAKSLTVVIKDTSVDVLEHDPAGWSKVQVGSTAGYIRSDFLKHAGTVASAVGGTGEQPPGDIIETRTTTGNNINVREQASTSSKILKTLSINTSVGVLANESNGWSKVTHSGTVGYIRSDLLSPSSAAAQAQVRYTMGNVNFRTGASTSASVIKTLTDGSAVEVVENQSNGWSKVTHAGTTGYIRSTLLTATVPDNVQTPPVGGSQTLYVAGNVNFRTSASTSSSVIRTLPNGTAVEVVENQSNGWSKVTHSGTTGYIRSDLLTATAQGSNQVIAIMRTVTGVNVRSGPSTSHSVITTLVGGTSVDVLANESNGWSKVKVGGITGYIKSDLLHGGASVELVTMSQISSILPMRQNIRVVDVRTGVSFNLRVFSKGGHADVETPTRDDTDTMFATRNGVRSWAARPIWVYVGDRVFAAALHGMPHDVSTISDNGLDGHLCLHFKDTVTTNKSYQADLRASVQEAYDSRPR